MTSRWNAWGAACLVVTSVGALAQYLVTPINPQDDAAGLVAAAAAHPDRMAWAVWLDLPILLVVPALLFVGGLAGARISRTAAIGAGLTFVTSLGAAGYLLALDLVIQSAARQPDAAAAAGVVDAYVGSALFLAVLLPYLVGHVIGFVLLGIALWRAGAVPVWAAAATAAWPFLEMAGTAVDSKPIGGLGFGLLVVSFGACAAALRRETATDAGAPAPAPVARTAVAS